jgi:hypothetical protein
MSEQLRVRPVLPRFLLEPDFFRLRGKSATAKSAISRNLGSSLILLVTTIFNLF